MNPEQLPITPDHDLLVELRTEMKGLRGDVKDLADDTKDRLTRLEEKKVDKDAFNDHLIEAKDHEKRIRFLEKGFWVALGIFTLLQLLGLANIGFAHFIK